MSKQKQKDMLAAYERYMAEHDVTRILRASIIESEIITEQELDEYTLQVEQREAAYLDYRTRLDAVTPLYSVYAWFANLKKKLKRE